MDKIAQPVTDRQKQAAAKATAVRPRQQRLSGRLKELSAPVLSFLDARVEEHRRDADGRPFRYERRLGEDGETLQIDLYFGPKVAAELDVRSSGSYRWLKLGGDEKIFRSPQSLLKTCFNLRGPRPSH